jgi:hydrogenase maturation protease
VADGRPRTVLIIGLGNELRGDDGAGVRVIDRLRADAPAAGIAVCARQGEPTELLNAWEDADAIVLVDTMRSGAPAGTVRRFDASSRPLPTPLRASSSTHALGLGETVELARSVDRLPGTVIVYGVEGFAFEAGDTLSPQVQTVVAGLADEVLREARELAAGG